MTAPVKVLVWLKVKLLLEPIKVKPPAPPSEDDFFRRPPDPHPPVAAGLHRQTWDTRYAGATDFPGMVMWAASSRGPQAPPGTYQVTVVNPGPLSSNAVSFTVQ